MKKTIISLISFVIFVYLLNLYLELEIAYSIGIGVLLLIHELGHVLALKKIEGKLNGIYFFPFIGAVVTNNKEIKTENDYARVKFFGPFIGFISIIPLFILYFITKQSLLIDLVFIGSLINLINLTPITLLDGHGILRGSIKHIEWLGFFIALFFIGYMLEGYTFSLLLVIVFFLFSDSPGTKTTGFKIWETVIAVLSILSIVIITIKEKNNLMPNLSILVIALYFFFAYIKAGLFDKNRKEVIIEILTPLTKKQKILWITRYVLLSTALLFLFFYSKIYS